MTIETTTWRGMSAWRLQTAAFELVVTVIGGHLAALTRRGEALNPLWQPGWESEDPAGLDRAAIERLGGEEPAARLLAAIVGHNLCIDRFGPPRPGEGRPFHGESGCVVWDRDADAEGLRIQARLDEAGLALTRHWREVDGAIELVTGVAHERAEVVPIEWCEHVSLGDPFVTGATFTAGVDGCWNFPTGAFEPGSRFDRPGLAELDPAAALAMPAPGDAPCGDVVACRVETGWFQVENAGHRLRYEWARDEFPWLALWTQHRSRSGAPWHGRERAKGMEFATKPFPEVENPDRVPEWQGRPTTCLVPPVTGLERRVVIRWDAV